MTMTTMMTMTTRMCELHVWNMMAVQLECVVISCDVFSEIIIELLICTSASGGNNLGD